MSYSESGSNDATITMPVTRWENGSEYKDTGVCRLLYSNGVLIASIAFGPADPSYAFDVDKISLNSKRAAPQKEFFIEILKGEEIVGVDVTVKDKEAKMEIETREFFDGSFTHKFSIYYVLTCRLHRVNQPAGASMVVPRGGAPQRNTYDSHPIAHDSSGEGTVELRLNSWQIGDRRGFAQGACVLRYTPPGGLSVQFLDTPIPLDSRFTVKRITFVSNDFHALFTYIQQNRPDDVGLNVNGAEFTIRMRWPTHSFDFTGDAPLQLVPLGCYYEDLRKKPSPIDSMPIVPPALSTYAGGASQKRLRDDVPQEGTMTYNVKADVPRLAEMFGEGYLGTKTQPRIAEALSKSLTSRQKQHAHTITGTETYVQKRPAEYAAPDFAAVASQPLPGFVESVETTHRGAYLEGTPISRQPTLAAALSESLPGRSKQKAKFSTGSVGAHAHRQTLAQEALGPRSAAF